MTGFRTRDNLPTMNVADFRSEPVGRFVQTARDGLALTFAGRGESRPPTSRRRERLLTAAAILGVLVIALSVAVLVANRVEGGRG